MPESNWDQTWERQVVPVEVEKGKTVIAVSLQTSK